MRKKHSHQKRTAADFLTLLSRVTVPDDHEPLPLPIQPRSPDPPSPVEFDLPSLQFSSSAIDFDSWFNGTAQPFGRPRPPFRDYKSDLGLISSTDATVPVSFPPLSRHLQSKTDFLSQDRLAPVILDYRDFVTATDSIERFRRLAAVHVVNHIYNDLTVRKLTPGRRDGTFTPTTVLVICPHRLQAFQFISEILNVLPDSFDDVAFEVEHGDRLNAEYSVEEVPKFLRRSKPKDWLAVFGGNADPDFKMGIRFFDNKVSLFQQMTKSQLVIASPLGLFLHDDSTDFMTSVEILVLDCLDALIMQPWDRLTALIARLNGFPKTVGETNWERIRIYCADKNHVQMRQNIGYGSVLTPEIHSLFSSCPNLRGGLMIRPLLYPAASLPGSDTTFKKLMVKSVQAIGDTIGLFFEDRLLPQIKQWRSAPAEEAKRTVIYFVSSLRFVQARKVLEDNNVTFLEMGDDANEHDGKRMRRGYRDDPKAVLLITERFYFHYRLPLTDVGRALFMQPPTFPHFIGELAGTAQVTVYFTEFDGMAVERIVGSHPLPRVLTSDTYVAA
jgi:U3 small nucleolar RNA-associated protein 25